MADKPALKPVEEIWAEKDSFNFEKLLEPYSEGGQQHRPVKRTIGIILDWLINKKKYPIEVVGAAILVVFWELHKTGKSFAGDGTYGSKGRELDLYIRKTCDKLLENKLQDKVFASIAGGRMAMIQEFINREVSLKTYGWYRKISPFGGRKKWQKMKAEWQSLVEAAGNESA